MMCIRKLSTSQPIAGTLIFNAFHAEPSVNTLSETVSTIIHEVFHALFFERTLFRYYPVNNKGLPSVYMDQSGTHQIQSDNFIKFARDHFNCKLYIYITIRSKYKSNTIRK
jgi:hypothetical protein